MGRFEEALADFNLAIELWPEAAWIVAEQEETPRQNHWESVD